MTERLSYSSQGNELPLVTVAMPIYNAGKYLRCAVLSIVNQTFTNWELLIIDDGSTDNALQDIADIKDKRIRILRDGINRGLAARLNEAIDLAKGQYFARMDGDDVSYPERFARQISVLQNDPELDVLATRAITIDESNQAIGLFPYAISHKEICAKPWRGFYFPHPTWMGKIAWFRHYLYTVPSPYCCEDQELLLRSYNKSRLATLDETLFAYRLRDITDWQKLASTRRAVFRVQLEHFTSFSSLHFLLLATMAFIGKTSVDYMKKISGRSFQSLPNIVNNNVLLNWYKLCDDLNILPKKS